MRQAAALTAMILALAGCTYHYNYPDQEPPPECRPFTATVNIDGQPRQVTGDACPQADGTWKIW